MKITSLNNEKVKSWLKLKQKKYRDIEGLFIVEGEHLTTEAMKKNNIKEILIAEDFSFPYEGQTYIVTKEILKKLSSEVTVPKVIAIVNKLEEKPYGNKLLLIDSLQDPGNLGTIIRSAVAFNFDIILGNNTVDLYNEKTIRATEGMLFHPNILKRDLKDFILKLKKANYKIYGTKVNSNKSLYMSKFEGNIAIIIGNEGKGINKELLSLCDEIISIPVNESCESLNAAIAASIIMYESERKNL